jgi:putative acetyltransferase
MGPGGETVFVAERAGRLLGYAALRGGEVTALFVRPAAARRGLGSRLLARVEREARRRGRSTLTVRASRNAALFYRARGYSGARAIRVPLPGGAAIAARRLARRIARPGSADIGPGAMRCAWPRPM